MNQKVKKSLSRREQVKKSGSTVFIVVTIASVLVMFSVTSMRFLWERKSYNDRVIGAKTKARDDIKSNLDNLGQLSQQFPQLESSASTNSKTILHALPPAYDYAALASSIDYLATLSGVSTNTNIGEDTSASSTNKASVSSPVEIPLTLQVNGSYSAIKLYIANLERSIRPINITSITYTGSTDSLQVSIQAITYYQPARSLDVEKKEVQ